MSISSIMPICAYTLPQGNDGSAYTAAKKKEIPVSLPDNVHSAYEQGGSRFYQSGVMPNAQMPLSIDYLNFKDYDEDAETPSYDNPVFEEFTKREGRVTFDEYADIISECPKIIEQAREYTEDKEWKYPLLQKPDETALFAHDIKKHFDKKYGEGNYTIVSIGASPAITTEAIAATGSNVMFLPVSGVHDLYSNYNRNIKLFLTDYPKTQVVCNYIKDALESPNGQLNNKSKIILLDYKSRGNTLNFVEDMFVKNCNVPQDRIETVDIKNLAEKFYGNDSSLYEKLYMDMGRQNVEEYANTPHYYIYFHANDLKRRYQGITTDNILKMEQYKYKNLENHSNPLARAYQLLVLDKLSYLYAAE